MTTLELVDALEAGIAALRSQNGHSVREEAGIPPATLRAELEKYGLSAADVVAATGVARNEVEEWLNGAMAAPAWLAAVIRVTGMLPLSERQKLRRQAMTAVQQRFPEQTHPFSRIEDL